MADTSSHWDRIYLQTQDTGLGWYETDFSQTMKFVTRAALAAGSRFFVAGAGASKLADVLLSKGYELTLNDISPQSLNRLEQRIGTQKANFEEGDLGTPMDDIEPVDFWLDRAVVHFLLKPQEITNYFDNLRSAVKPGGFVLLAEFAQNGAQRCAGLAVHRYSLDEMQQRLGPHFDLLSSEDYVFINPNGDAKPYIYALFQRRP